MTVSVRAKQRQINAAIKARAGAECNPKIIVEKAGARRCSTCGARASTAKTMLVCARTGRLPGVNVTRSTSTNPQGDKDGSR